MIDLHIHTKYSDGTYTVKEVLQEAEKLGLKYISITSSLLSISLLFSLLETFLFIILILEYSFFSIYFL